MTPAESEIKRKELPSKEFDEWLRSYQVARIYDNIWGTVSRRYIEQEELSVSKDELDEITASVEQQMESNAEPPIGTTLTPLQRKGVSIAWASASLTDWKVCKSLYEKYGGRVGIGSLGGWTALDGQHALLREHHKAGDIKFHHAKIEAAFWKYAQRERFADAYPKGESLQRLLSTPPYSRSDKPGKQHLNTSSTVSPSSPSGVGTTTDPNPRERIGSALGNDVYRDQITSNPPKYSEVVQLFMKPALDEFREQHLAKIDMTDEEIKSASEWQTEQMKEQGKEIWNRGRIAYVIKEKSFLV